MDQKMPVLIVAASSAAAITQPTMKTEPAAIGISPLLIIGIIAVAAGFSGLIVALRHKSRFTLGLTVVCLLVGVASFMTE
jgi:hypothetical protein